MIKQSPSSSGFWSSGNVRQMAMVCTHHRNSTCKGRLVFQSNFSCDTEPTHIEWQGRLDWLAQVPANLVFLMAMGLLTSFSCDGKCLYLFVWCSSINILQYFSFQFVSWKSQSIFLLCVIGAGITLCVIIAEHLWLSCRILRMTCYRAGTVSSGIAPNRVVIQTRKPKVAWLSCNPFPSLVTHQVQDKWDIVALMEWSGSK